jgi:lipoprotein-anchoring transpeptidase ErfK/SrfK
MRRAAVLAVAAIAAAATGCGGGSGANAPATTASAADGAIAPATPPRPSPAASTPSPRAAAGDPVARVLRPIALRSAPGGAVVARLRPRTEWGEPRYLPVVRRRGRWLGVIATQQPNGRVGWIDARATRAAVSPLRLVADLSERRLRVLRGGRTVLSIPVGVGAAATPTPTGRFGITDALTPPADAPYGCCILALSGHQPNVPQGWAGGDRLAIHGTSDPSSIGRAASSGCLRASDRDLHRLMGLVGLGAVLRIRA